MGSFFREFGGGLQAAGAAIGRSAQGRQEDEQERARRLRATQAQSLLGQAAPFISGFSQTPLGPEATEPTVPAAGAQPPPVSMIPERPPPVEAVPPEIPGAVPEFGAQPEFRGPLTQRFEEQILTQEQDEEIELDEPVEELQTGALVPSNPQTQKGRSRLQKAETLGLTLFADVPAVKAQLDIFRTMDEADIKETEREVKRLDADNKRIQDEEDRNLATRLKEQGARLGVTKELRSAKKDLNSAKDVQALRISNRFFAPIFDSLNSGVDVEDPIFQLVLVKSIEKLVQPNSAVLQGEADAYRQANTFLNRLVTDGVYDASKSALLGKLGPKDVKSMIGIIDRIYTRNRQAADNYIGGQRKFYNTIFRDTGADEQDVQNIFTGLPKSFDKELGKLSDLFKNPPKRQQDIINQAKQRLQKDLREQGITIPGITPRQPTGARAPVTPPPAQLFPEAPESEAEELERLKREEAGGQ